MKAINYYIVIDKIKEEPKKIAGLEVTESQNKEVRYLKGEVISVGDKIDNVKTGDIVRYDRHAGHGVEWDDKLFYVLKITDIVLIE
jgi:co-chaperonin GroES (HSP10)